MVIAWWRSVAGFQRTFQRVRPPRRALVLACSSGERRQPVYPGARDAVLLASAGP